MKKVILNYNLYLKRKSMIKMRKDKRDKIEGKERRQKRSGIGDKKDRMNETCIDATTKVQRNRIRE